MNRLKRNQNPKNKQSKKRHLKLLTLQLPNLRFLHFPIINDLDHQLIYIFFPKKKKTLKNGLIIEDTKIGQGKKAARGKKVLFTSFWFIPRSNINKKCLEQKSINQIKSIRSLSVILENLQILKEKLLIQTLKVNHLHLL